MQAKSKCRLSLNKAKSEPGSGRALLLQSKAREILGDISMSMQNILSTCSLVYLITPTSLPTYSVTGRIYFFHTSGIPIRPFQAEFTIFTDASTQCWGAHMGDSQILGTWTHEERGYIPSVWSSKW